MVTQCIGRIRKNNRIAKFPFTKSFPEHCETIHFSIFMIHFRAFLPWFPDLDPLHWELRILTTGPPGKSESYRILLTRDSPGIKSFPPSGYALRWGFFHLHLGSPCSTTSLGCHISMYIFNMLVTHL